MRIGPSATSVADFLRLAATPTFALMALLTALAGNGPAAPLCSEAGGPSLIVGMAPMYVLMALFHVPPWFRA